MLVNYFVRYLHNFKSLISIINGGLILFNLSDLVMVQMHEHFPHAPSPN